MIATEDIKIGAIVRHLGHPGDWGQTCADHFALFNVTEDYDADGDFFTKDSVHIAAVKANTDLFELAVTIARPILAERKVGKCQMHMVDDGFPRALRHIAEIMTWADEAKQYKLHDWRNLPNPDIEFPAAEYRHKNDNSTQKAEGLSALERVDPESGKLHIGHKLFNALCELELVLAGKIK